MRKRKIVQVAVADDNNLTYPTLVALCNDGTLWILEQKCPTHIVEHKIIQDETSWKLLEGVPQPQPRFG